MSNRTELSIATMLTWLGRDPVRACEWPVSTKIILNFRAGYLFREFARRVREFCEHQCCGAVEALEQRLISAK